MRKILFSVRQVTGKPIIWNTTKPIRKNTTTLCYFKTKHRGCGSVKLYMFGMTWQTIWHYLQRNWSMFQCLTHAKPPRSMAFILEMLQYVAYLKNIAYCFIKECGMGTLFVLVSPCFRENVVVTCKIGSFLCSLDTLLQISVIVFFFGNQISKWRSFKKKGGGYFWPTFHIFNHQWKIAKIPSANISLAYIHTCILLTLLTFLPYQFWKKYQFIRYGSLWYESCYWFLFAPFWNNQ